MLRLILLCILASVPALAQEFDGAKNMTLFGYLNPVDSVGAHAAIWGYVAPDGREYAFLGSQIGTHIIDVTTAPIRQVAFIAGPPNKWREMKTYRNYLYISSEFRDSGGGLQIVDLASLPASATLVNNDTTYFKSAHTLFVRDHYLFVMGTAAEAGANGGVMIFDLEPDPIHPRLLGRADKQYYHDAWMRGDTMVAAAVYGGGIDMYDVTDKSNPVFLVNINYPYSGTHNVEITSDGGYLISSDEIGFTAKTMKVWDIRDLQNIRMVAEHTHNLLDVVHNVHVFGRYAVVSWYTGGVRIIDLIDPAHPREVAYYDTYPGPSGGYDGVWEAFAWLPSGRVLAGDRNTGLYVLDWERRVGGSISGVIRNRSNGLPIPNVAIYVKELDTTLYSGNDGRYYIGGAVGDTVTLVLQHYGFAGETTTSILTGDATADIEMTPLVFRIATLRVQDASGAPITGFSYAVEPHIVSTMVNESETEISLPGDSTFTLTVGKWGYRVVVMPVTLLQMNETITVTLERRYHDNATLDLGWSLGAPGDNAETGQWVRIVPYLGYPQSIWIHPSAEPGGTYGRVFMTGEPPRYAAPQDNDVNLGVTSLVSPIMDLRDHTDPVLSYDLWFVHYPNFRSDTTLALDSFAVDVSNDDGMTWYRLRTEVRGRGTWGMRDIPFGSVLPMTDRMRIRFQAIDTAEPTLFFAAVDNFEIAPTPATVGVDDESRPSAVRVIPNPSSGDARIDIAQRGTIVVELFDALGVRVATLFDGEAAGELRLLLPEALPAGTYLLRARGAVTEVHGIQVVR
jgi:choice-of-anchor B domain-containing protein